MKLYHGSKIEGIKELKPFLSNHQKPYCYFTDSLQLAMLYTINVFAPPNGFFPYWWSKEGVINYDEYYKNQLKEFYGGKSGYVYVAEENLSRLDKMSWIFISETPVKVKQSLYIPDVYKEIMLQEKKGSIKINHFEQITEEGQKMINKIIRQEIKDNNLKERQKDEYSFFIKTHFPDIWQE